ncbi:MAG TPA: acyl-CoA thioesterase [Propionibacterium sp.]|nr:acyl-CoA thioesterase [Propionibacterium sp.]
MSNNELTFRFLAAPTDIGLQGKVPGGRVLEWIDKAAYGIAVAWAKKPTVTAYVGNVVFNHAIANGELVETNARIVRTGRTSMTILVTVRAGSPQSTEMHEACRCALVFVAIDENGKSVEVPPFVPQTELDQKFFNDAEELNKSRQEIEQLMSRASYTDAGQGERITMRFLAKPTDVNWGGKVHGGTVMGWIDEAAYACAQRWTGGEAIAVYAGGVRFYRPMIIGHLVEIEARLLHTTEKTMHISVHVRTGDPTTRLMELTCHCLMVLVGLDDKGEPTDITQWRPTIGEDIALDRHAQDLQEARQSHGYMDLFVAPAGLE